MSKFFCICILFTAIFLCVASIKSQSHKDSNEIKVLHSTIDAFAKAWLADGKGDNIAKFISKHPLVSRCSSASMQLQTNPQTPLLDCLSNMRKSIKGNVDPNDVFEALAVVNPIVKFDTQLGWGTLIRVKASEAGGLLASEAEFEELQERHKKGRFYVLAFKLKGVPDGIVPPIVLLWEKERNEWRILDIGTVKM